jgi:hypothetical protein
MEIKVSDFGDRVAHRNLYLIRGQVPEDAYEKANCIGKGAEIDYENPLGYQVTHRFRGVFRLEELIDGTPVERKSTLKK